MKVAVIAAHPDDETLGVFGTVVKHINQGDEVRLLVAYTCRIRPPARVEWLQAPKGSNVTPDIERAVAEIQPDIVYTHHAGDINADHRTVHEAVMVACRPYAAPSVRSIRAFYTPSSTEWGSGFVPNLFVDITDSLDEKLRVMEAHYASEMREAPHPRSAESLRATAAFYGAQAGFRYAEPFVLVRERW